MAIEKELEAARKLVAEAEQAEMEAEAKKQNELMKPYNDFKESKAVQTMLEDLVKLRTQYIDKDERLFRQLDAVYQTLQRI